MDVGMLLGSETESGLAAEGSHRVPAGVQRISHIKVFIISFHFLCFDEEKSDLSIMS